MATPSTPRVEQDRWAELISTYLQTRPQLKCVCLLIDGRHGVLANDINMMKQLDRAAASYQVILTKIDLVKEREREDRLLQVAAILHHHPAARPEVLTASAEKRLGLGKLQRLLADFADKKAP